MPLDLNTTLPSCYLVDLVGREIRCSGELKKKKNKKREKRQRTKLQGKEAFEKATLFSLHLGPAETLQTIKNPQVCCRGKATITAEVQ